MADQNTSGLETEKQVGLSDLQTDTMGVGALFTDTFGLNADGIQTIWALFKNPAPYFEAAKGKVWPGFYRPSIRVYISIMALSAGLRFIWGSDTSPMMTLYADLFQQIADGVQKAVEDKGETVDFSEFDPLESAKVLFKYYLVILPILYMVIVAFLAVIYRAWGQTISYVVRLRYLFAILIPGSTIGLLSSVMSVGLPREIFQSISFVFMGLMTLMYFLTAYRGAFAHCTDGRVWRSISVSVLLLVTVFIATIIALFIAMVPTIATTFPRAT